MRPLLAEEWILVIDTTVKPVYGRQDGAVIGNNPGKRGRLSQAIYVYEMAGTRVVLDAEVEAGNRSHAQYGLEGTERVMAALEQRGPDYLFKLVMRKKVKELVGRLARERMAGKRRGRGGRRPRRNCNWRAGRRIGGWC